MVMSERAFEYERKEMREVLCEALQEAARSDPRIVAVHCDLCTSMGLKPFVAEFPERSINVGIQEANGCSMAGGMSAAGMIPFFNTFAVFATRRVYDQIFMSCAYPGLNVKIIGGDAGVSSAFNGGTHMAFEDMGIMRVMPNVTVMEPSDSVMLRALIRQMAQTYGVQYLRMVRKKAVSLYRSDSEFEIGKAAVLREGNDVAIIACGLLVAEALKAAERLAAEGIEARVVDMFTIKPIDEACILESAARTGAIVTAENHQVIGGLGSAVAEVLGEGAPAILERVGVRGEFGEVGAQDYLMERFGLTAGCIAERARAALARKAS